MEIIKPLSGEDRWTCSALAGASLNETLNGAGKTYG